MKGQYSCTLRHFKIILLLHVTTKNIPQPYVHTVFCSPLEKGDALSLQKEETFALLPNKVEDGQVKRMNENFIAKVLKIILLL